jgi:hypothetical protein
VALVLFSIVHCEIWKRINRNRCRPPHAQSCLAHPTREARSDAFMTGLLLGPGEQNENIKSRGKVRVVGKGELTIATDRAGSNWARWYNDGL